MKKVPIRYATTFGKGDSSDWIERGFELTDEEAVAYDNALESKLLLNEISELQDALERAYAEIEEEEIDMGIDIGVEYVLECQGEAEMDPYELNELVAKRDPHTLEYFDLTEVDEEELDEWDAYDLDELPLIKEFEIDFEPYSPYDAGWTLNVEFVDPNE